MLWPCVKVALTFRICYNTHRIEENLFEKSGRAPLFCLLETFLSVETGADIAALEIDRSVE